LSALPFSATVEPLDRVAAWLGGSELHRQGREIEYDPREVEIIDVKQKKTSDFRVRYLSPKK